MVGHLERQIRQWAESIVDVALEREECDFVSEIAYKLPMNVIADIVGIPPQDRMCSSRWPTTCSREALRAGMSRNEHIGIQVEMFEYAQKLGQEKRANPEDDVWTILSTVQVEDDDGERTALSEIELDMFFLLLIIAGSETTGTLSLSGFLRCSIIRSARSPSPRAGRDSPRGRRSASVVIAGLVLRRRATDRPKSEE